MRIIKNIATEGHVDPMAVMTISLEEEQLVMDEANAVADEIQQDLSEAERLTETVDALEDLAVVTDAIEEPTAEHVALVETVGQMAVAGTDVAVDEIVPVTEVAADLPEGQEAGLGDGSALDNAAAGEAALESHKAVKYTIATESIRDRAKQIWQAVQNTLKSIWDRIVQFFRVNVMVPVYKKKIAILAKAVDGLGAQKADGGKFKIAGASSLAISEKTAASNATELAAGVKGIYDALTYITTKNVPAVKARAEAVAAVLNAWTPEQAGALANDLATTLSKKALPSIPGATKSKDRDYDIETSPYLMGGGNLVLKSYQRDESDSALGALDRLRTSGVVYQSSRPQITSQVDFETLSVAEMKKMLDEATGLLSILERFEKSDLSTLKSAADKLRAASDKATTAMSKASDGGSMNEYRSAVNFNLALTRWVQQPQIAFYSKVLNTVSTINAVVAKSAAQYEAKAAK